MPAADSSAGGLIDRDALAVWLDGVGFATGEALEIERLSGGYSNEMFRLRRGSRSAVLRRPSGKALARAADGLKREFRVLSALDATDVPHPRTVALCGDDAVLGCTFYVMESVSGFTPVAPLPAPFDTPRGVGEVALAQVDALASLHEVDWRGVGLADFGRPDDFHERQVRRWLGQLESYAGRELPGLRDVGAWLDAHRPAGFEPSIMHGDYHVMNVMIAPAAPARVAAIVDWETATIGDPWLDLAGFLRMWFATHPDCEPGWDALIVRYAERRGNVVPDFAYYLALYHFRMAVLLEGVYQRSLSDDTRPDAVFMGETAVANAKQAVEATR